MTTKLARRPLANNTTEGEVEVSLTGAPAAGVAAFWKKLVLLVPPSLRATTVTSRFGERLLLVVDWYTFFLY